MDNNGQDDLARRIERFFRAGGALSRLLEGFEPRPSQARMAQACLRALRSEGILLVEAGTGTGKTLAYLVPALAAGRRVVISTGTKNLQEQLFFKDVPFLQDIGGSFSCAVMKGRGNYLCLRKLELFRAQPLLKGLEEVDQFKDLERWAARTATGDFAEFGGVPEGQGLQAQLSCRAENCIGRKCPHHDGCWLVKMRLEAAEADIVIVNHHLLFADLNVKEGGFGAVIPEFDRMVIDEAHEIEEVATSYFGVEISNWRLEELTRDSLYELASENITDTRLLALVADIESRSRELFSSIKAPAERFLTRQVVDGAVTDALSRLCGSLEQFEAGIGLITDRPESLFTLARRCAQLRGELELALIGDDPDYVFWGERRGRGLFLRASPIDISGQMRSFLSDGLSSAVLTSATLAVDGSFDYLRCRLGIESAEEIQLPSPFDFRELTRLYVPPELPEPSSPDFIELAVGEVERLLRLTEGRTFILFTSLRNMDAAHALLAGRVEFPLLLQGSAPRRELLERFRAEEGAVLMASASFWQGVDVRGPQLSCVVIDKLPFAVPDDPIVQSRIERLRTEGSDPFWSYQVPAAALTLKQGLGRLVRSSTDRGIMAVLDGRLLRRRYGQVFLRSLHGSPVLTDFEALADWWRQAELL